MKSLTAVLILTAAFFAGCATQSSQPGAEKPPQHAERVKVLMYDSSPRAKLEHIDIIDETTSVQRPYKEIALLTCEGANHEETEMTEAILYRARMIGAQAVILLPSNRHVDGFGSGRSVFRGKAVVWMAPK